MTTSPEPEDLAQVARRRHVHFDVEPEIQFRGSERVKIGTELEPYRPALYESRVVPAADEVSLTIRLIHRDGYDRPVDRCEERCLREIRARLRALGIAER